MKKFMLVLFIGLFSVTLNSSETVAQKGPKITILGITIDEKDHWKCVCLDGECVAAKAITTRRICKKATIEDPDCTKAAMNCPKKD